MHRGSAGPARKPAAGVDHGRVSFTFANHVPTAVADEAWIPAPRDECAPLRLRLLRQTNRVRADEARGGLSVLPLSDLCECRVSRRRRHGREGPLRMAG